jgi:ornithine--oxo-acid transaminase
VLLGKAYQGGLLPVSVVLADKEIMESSSPDNTGPLMVGIPGRKSCCAALDVLLDEELSRNAEVLGELLKKSLFTLKEDCAMDHLI